MSDQPTDYNTLALQVLKAVDSGERISWNDVTPSFKNMTSFLCADGAMYYGYDGNTTGYHVAGKGYNVMSELRQLVGDAHLGIRRCKPLGLSTEEITELLAFTENEVNRHQGNDRNDWITRQSRIAQESREALPKWLKGNKDG